MSWHIYVVVKNIANLGQALLQTSYKNWSFSQRNLMVPIGKRVPLVGETIIDASSRLELCFLQATWNDRISVLKYKLIQGSFGLLYTN